MFDFHDFVERRTKENDYKIKLEMLADLKQRISSRYFEYEDTCDHNLILHLGSEVSTKDNDFAICVCCGNSFHLDDVYSDEREKIKPENIISLVGYIDDDFLHTYCGDQHILVTRAQIKLYALAQIDPNIPFSVLKEEVKNDLLMYTLEKQRKREERLSRVRDRK